MRIQTTGNVRKVYKDPVDGWCVVVKSGNIRSTYIKIPKKPKARPGDVVEAGDKL